jgi:Glycosyl hydrolase family 26
LRRPSRRVPCDTSSVIVHRRRAALILALVTFGALSLGLPSSSRPAGSASPIAFGLTTGLSQDRLTRVKQVEAETGGRVSLVNWFQWFGSSLLTRRAETIFASGRTPVLSWQPVEPGSGAPSELPRIVSGDDDAYLTTFARSVKALPGVLWIRFAPEMNGAWEPWGAGTNGNVPATLVEAWSHVHRVFADAGVTNVKWFWCPNVPTAGQASLADLYPGDSLVDIVGVDGYNFGSARTGSRWRSAGEIFDRGITQLRALSSRPIVLGEVATVAQKGREGAWIRDFFAGLDRSRTVSGFIWFDISKKLNTRIDATPRSRTAFRAAVVALHRGIAANAASALRSG